MNPRLQYRYAGMGSADVGLPDVVDRLPVTASEQEIVDALAEAWADSGVYKPAHLVIVNREEMIAAVRELLLQRDCGDQ